MPTALVLGGSGQIGSAAALNLSDAGWCVTAATRDHRALSAEQVARGIKRIDASGKSRLQLLQDADQTFDALIDPTAYDLGDARDLLSIQARIGAFVVISSSSVYADPQGRSLDEAWQGGVPELETPIRETTPTVSPGPSTYSTRKIAMEQALGDSVVPVTILRPCAVYGRFARHLREWWFIKRALDGRRHIPLAYNGESVFHTSSVTGIASLIECALRSPTSAILNVADPGALPVRTVASSIEAAIQRPLPLTLIDGPPNRAVGRSPWTVPRPYVLDTSRARTLGWNGGEDYATEVGPVCCWALESCKTASGDSLFPLSQIYGGNAFDYAAEDNFLGTSSSTAATR